MCGIALFFATLLWIGPSPALGDGEASKSEWDAIKNEPRLYVPTRRPEHERARRELQECFDTCVEQSEADRRRCETHCREKLRP
jgi:hypothetical protein